METPQIGRENQWTIQGFTDSCQWDIDDRIKTRRLRKNQHKKGYTVQRTRLRLSDVGKLCIDQPKVTQSHVHK